MSDSLESRPLSEIFKRSLNFSSACPCGAACSVVIAPLRIRLPCPAGSPAPPDLFRCRRRCSLLDLSPRFGSPRRASPVRPGNGSLRFVLCVPMWGPPPLLLSRDGARNDASCLRTVFFPRSSSCPLLPVPFSPIPPAHRPPLIACRRWFSGRPFFPAHRPPVLLVRFSRVHRPPS